MGTSKAKASAGQIIVLNEFLSGFRQIVTLNSAKFTVWLSSPGSMTNSLPMVGVFAVAMAQLMPQLTSLGTLPMRFMVMLPNLELVYRVINGPVPTRNDGTVLLGSFEKAIVFENVSFAYKGREPLFDGLNLTLEKGAVTAIVGSSGAGKTSIIT